MSDYAVQVKLRNARLLRAIESKGHKTIGAFCTANSMKGSEVYRLLNFKASPLTPAGRWSLPVQRLCAALDLPPEVLFAEEQRTLVLERNHATIEVDEVVMRRLAGREFETQRRMTEPSIKDPAELVTHTQLATALTQALESIPPRMRDVVEMAFGLKDGVEHSMKDIADKYGSSRENIRQILNRALRHLQHPNRSELVRPFLDSSE